MPASSSLRIRILSLPVLLAALTAGLPLPVASAAPAFSTAPSDAEIGSSRILELPLVPMGGATTLDENRDLAESLLAYAGSASLEDLSPLTGFLDRHPASPWRASLLADLGLAWRRAGYFSRAMDAWERAWPLAKAATSPAAHALADRVVGELIQLNSWMGRVDRVEAYLAEVAGRPISGRGANQIVQGYENAWMMRNRPGISFKCGPYAVGQIWTFLHPDRPFRQEIVDAQSTSQGTSLAQVRDLAAGLGLDFQMARRSPGAPFLTPAVVHWKLGHFGALLREKDGRYLWEDATADTDYGMSRSLSPDALEAESSGYFLVPAGPLPEGWRAVGDEEGAGVWGKGYPGGSDNQGTTTHDLRVGKDSCDGNSGMARYAFHAMLASLNITDTPVRYAPPRGPAVGFEIVYNHKENQDPPGYGLPNLGPKWTYNWQAYIEEDPFTQANGIILASIGGGGWDPFFDFNPGNQTWSPQVETGALLRQISVEPRRFEMTWPDGTREIFDVDNGGITIRKTFVSRIIDPIGNTLGFSYDAQLRLIAVTDSLGQVTTISYESASDPFKITKVTDPFGRFATFEYDLSGRLIRITDQIGLTSELAYTDPLATDFITSMTTPYGTTTFTKSASDLDPDNHWIMATDPNGDSERVEFRQRATPSVPFTVTDVPAGSGMSYFNSFMDGRNSFFWDKKAWHDAPGDYSKAHIYHWLHANGALVSRVLESEKAPLENRVWYRYPNQDHPATPTGVTIARPSNVARLMDDGSTQVSRFEYNSFGRMTLAVDPRGREIRSDYFPNQIDLQKVRQTTGGINQVLAEFTYNAQHLPLTAKDASGRVTTFTYNAFGQPISVTNAKGETTTMTYDASGFLTQVTGPAPTHPVLASLVPDSLGRVLSATDSEGYTLTYEYDDADRLTLTTFPDGTTRQVQYDRLFPGLVFDRQGRRTRYTWNALHQLESVLDAENRLTRYGWCLCGELRTLTDPNDHTTTWERDVQGRLTKKRYADARETSYQYESTTSRLKKVTDARGQETSYEYFLDNDLKRVSYTNAVIPTPEVSLTYEAAYNRVAAMRDGSGTTTYQYVPITGSLAVLGQGQIQSIDGPLTRDRITYRYDELGRELSHAINGVGQSMAFDTLGRVKTATNALGTFAYGYLNDTAQLVSATAPNGLRTALSYLGNEGDRRLQTLRYENDSEEISRFEYTYAPEGAITHWEQLASTARAWDLGYDKVDQLIEVDSLTKPTYGYSYDPAGNRLTERIGARTTDSTYDVVNALATSAAPFPHALTYDENGNLATDAGRTYAWDAADRLVSVDQGAHRSEFSYDGLSRMVRIVEKQGGMVVSDQRFVWCRMELCEERDASGASVTKRYFLQGMEKDGKKLYYTRDHLGSVREVLDEAGKVRGRYDYDPYGRRTRSTGDVEADCGFAGMYFHAPTGLHLAVFRAYSADLGRWINRDPIGEEGGINLYQYVMNRPAHNTDRLGLVPEGVQPGPYSPEYMEKMGWKNPFGPEPLGFWRSLVKGLIRGVIVGVFVAVVTVEAPAIAPVLVIVGEIKLIADVIGIVRDPSPDKIGRLIGSLLGTAAVGEAVPTSPEPEPTPPEPCPGESV